MTKKETKKTEDPVDEFAPQENEVTNPDETMDPPGDEIAPQGDEVAKPVDNVLAVVIPYVKEFAQGNELMYAIASWHKNLKDTPFKIVVIGDSEEWFEENDIIHIPHVRMSDNPQEDVLEKLKLAISSEEVSQKFIWTNDDIYLVSPVLLSDIQVLKCKGQLSESGHNGVYQQNVVRTIEFLKEYPKHDYATHTPVVFDKEGWVALFEHFPELNSGGYLLSSVYFNVNFEEFVPIQLDWKTDNWALPVVKPAPNETTFRELVAKKKFLNNAVTGYSEWLMKQLEKILQ